MYQAPQQLYEFGLFRLNRQERTLLRDGVSIALTPKAFDLLLALVERHGRLMEKEELFKTVWPDTIVEESNLAYNISQIRKTLNDGENGLKFIETVPKRGYRFVAEVREVLPAMTGDVRDMALSPLHISEQNGTAAAEQANTNELAHSTSLTESPVAEITPPRKRLRSAFPIILVVIMGISYGVYRFGFQNQSPPRRVKAFQAMKVTRITNSGKSKDAAISPDGKYVAYVVEDSGQQSLWVRQVVANSTIQIVAAAEAKFNGLTFSPDSNYIYYVYSELNQSLPSLYQVPVLGGSAKRLLTEVFSPVTFSPNGKMLAFMRREALMIANADGTGARELSSHTQHSLDYPVTPYYAPAWSPDGKIVACPDGRVSSSEHYHNLVGVQVEDGDKKPITLQQWAGLFQVAWQSDGTGLFMAAGDKDSHQPQLWYLSYPAGEPQRITNDLVNYGGLSLTSDSNSLVSVQYEQQINLWVLPNSDTSRARQISFGAGRDEDIAGISWTPDGQIVYVSQASRHGEIWLTKPDGGSGKQLTFDEINKAWPAVTSDGQYIVYTAVVSGSPSIWRINIDGTNPKQLSDIRLSNFPDCSPDGKWVVFSSRSEGLWKVPIDGGTTVQLSKRRLVRPAVSPDGKLIACRFKEQVDAPEQLAVLSFDGGEPIKLFVAPSTIDEFTRVLWTPDGKGLAYVNKQGNVSNLWVQPLDGSAPKQLTDFKSDQMLKFAWSRDGRQLALSRGTVTSDVVLISEIK